MCMCAHIYVHVHGTEDGPEWDLTHCPEVLVDRGRFDLAAVNMVGSWMSDSSSYCPPR